MDSLVNRAARALLAGKTILYPTDTIWGIGCDARNEDAIERIYSIKGRDRSKSMLVLADCKEWGVPEGDRPTTYILPETIWRPLLGDGIATNLPAEDGTLGVRVPNHEFCRQLIHLLGAPIVSTSANFSGQATPATYGEIEEELKLRVDYCVPPLEAFLTGETRGSRIVKVSADGHQTILRP